MPLDVDHPALTMTALSLPGVDTLPPEKLRQKALSQWFTPEPEARRLARMAGSPPMHWRVLEPSAGDGALVAAMYECAPMPLIEAVELDPRFAARLRARFHQECAVVECCDYLTRPAPSQPYDCAIMNPPYEGGLDSAFVSKAMDESLRVLALVRLAMLESQRAYERVWSRIESGEWSLVEMVPFVSRPVFLAAGEESDSGKTAFMAIKLSRVPGMPRLTGVGWAR